VRGGGRQHAATPTGGRWAMPPPPLAAGGPCRHPHRRQVAGRGMPPTTLAAGGRRGHAATPNGGRDTCRLPRGCRHPQLVLFDKNFRRGSFLAFHSGRWSDPSKIHLFCSISLFNRGGGGSISEMHRRYSLPPACVSLLGSRLLHPHRLSISIDGGGHGGARQRVPMEVPGRGCPWRGDGLLADGADLGGARGAVAMEVLVAGWKWPGRGTSYQPTVPAVSLLLFF
jgi:hypothetical protein